MAFVTSQAAFESVFGSEAVPEKKPQEIFFGQLGRYLKKKKNVRGAVELGKWIDAGKPIVAFTCREDVVEPLAIELGDKGVPYAVTVSEAGETGFVVREPDEKAVSAAEKEVLGSLSCTCMVVPGKEVRKKIGLSKEKDKTVLAVCNLTPAQAEIIRKLYGQYHDGAVIGLDRHQDGTYSLSVPAKKSIKRSAREGMDLCGIILEAMLTTGGPIAVIVNGQAAKKMEFDERLAKNFQEKGINLNRTPLWIAGTGFQYMKVTGNGFEYGHVRPGKASPVLEAQVQASTAQPDYRQLLISYTQRIPDKVVTYDAAEVLRHFQTPADAEELDFLDIKKTPEERMYARGETKAARQMDMMVARKIQGDGIMLMDGRYNEKLKHYLDEAAQLLAALQDDRVPAGYEPDDVESLRRIFADHKMEAEMYETAVENMRGLEALDIVHSVERIADIAKLIEQQEQGKEQERGRGEERGSRRKSHSGPGE